MKIFDIRFAKIYFVITFVEDTTFVRNKVSAFRGGIGEMLLRANCVRNRRCEKCDFSEECLVRKMMYAKAREAPGFVTEGESMGYVYECENRQEHFRAGESIELSLTLFGSCIVYFPQYIGALAMLGQIGIGKNQSRFVITEIRNMYQEPVLTDGNILMGNYKIETLAEYIRYREKKISSEGNRAMLEFVSPTTLKFQGEFLQKFDLDAIYRAALRRIHMLDCFEGIEFDESLKFLSLPYRITEQSIMTDTVKRYSNHKEQKTELRGIRGKVWLEKTEEQDNRELFWKVLLAGEVLHIGKNTSFGFGKYCVK